MAIVTRYFSTSSAGAGDGTSWADRAALIVSSQWSSIIRSFNFSGSDSLIALVGPGTYVCNQSLADAAFTNPPRLGKTLTIAACDSSGNQIGPVDPNWSAAQPIWDLTNIPRIEVAANIRIANQSWTHFRNLHFLNPSTNNNTGGVTGGGYFSWCVIENNQSGASASGVAATSAGSYTNCAVKVTGSTFDYAVDIATTSTSFNNVRIETNASASSGNRAAFKKRGNAPQQLNRVVIYGAPLIGFDHQNDGTVSYLWLQNCIAYGCGTAGARQAATTTLTRLCNYDSCIFVNNGTYGVDTGGDNVVLTNSRLRDNGTADRSNTNIPLVDCVTSAGVDADEFVDAASGDLRIKNTSSLWGKGIGAGDEPPPTGGGGGTRGFAIIS